MATYPLHQPGQGGRRGLVSRGQQGQQLVGDVPVGDRRAIFVTRPQHQRQHIGTLLEGRIATCLGDQRVDDLVVAAPVASHGAAGAAWSEVAPEEFRQQREPRPDFNSAGQRIAQFVECRTLGTEHRAQDRVEGDAHHRRQRLELDAVGPAGDLAHHLFLDDRLVAVHALAVEWRHQQLAPFPVLLAVEAEGGARAEHLAEVRRPPHQVTAGGEQVLDQGGIADQHRLAEDRQVQGDRGSVASGNLAHYGPARREEANALNQSGGARAWWEPYRIGRRLSHRSRLSASVRRCTDYGTLLYRMPQRRSAGPAAVVLGLGACRTSAQEE